MGSDGLEMDFFGLGRVIGELKIVYCLLVGWLRWFELVGVVMGEWVWVYMLDEG